MQHPHVVDRHAAGLGGQRDGAGEVGRLDREVDRAMEIAVVMMVVDLAAVGARHDHQRPVLQRHVIEHDADRQ